MGWNSGYAIFESTVIGAYDLGKLDRALLDVLMEPYRGTDIDHGGSVGLRSKDGKTADEIAVEVFGLAIPAGPDVPLPDYDRWREWNEEEKAQSATWDDWRESCDDLFRKVSDHYGWG